MGRECQTVIPSDYKLILSLTDRTAPDDTVIYGRRTVFRHLQRIMFVMWNR